MKLRSLFLISCLTASSICGNAQQIQLDNQYVMNKFSLSPAYAGINESYEAFMTYRKMWMGVDGAPELKMLNANGAINEKMGIGASVVGQQAGIFRSFSGTLSYAYHLKINGMQSVSFGLSAGMFENHMSLAGGASTDPSVQSDPVVMNTQTVTQKVFDASFGILYQYQKIHAGIMIPRILESKIKNKDASNDVLYTLKRHYLIHASYVYDINEEWQVQPAVVARTTQNSPLFYDVAAMVKYKKMVWLGLIYRKGTNIGISLGGLPYERIALNYSYELSGNGIHGTSSGTHEISIGILINKAKSKNKPYSVFTSSSDQPFMDWLE